MAADIEFNDDELDAAIQKNLKRLTTIFKDIETNKRSLLSKQIENAAYIEAKLEQLKAQLDKAGMTDMGANGQTKKSAEIDAYMNLQKVYIMVIKQLSAVCPTKPKPAKLKGFAQI